ncbi:MAG: heme ABC exporter ATP-binding protein CcmA [Robiginitomaculum sp.]|nr:heme ABC exporter ATP-binding protein CcmA [Robiginitomaculum sp.]MDQ7076613.1 heme ABC exporter ATP-binding protein CcmA [Robiginitomaculum sp.]
MSAVSFEPISLRAQELGCDRGGQPIFRGVSFVLNPGEAMILRGDNGAGKTSLLRLLAGLLPIAEGSLEIKTAQTDWQNGTAAGRIAWQGHEDAHKRALTVLENLAFWARIHESNYDLKKALGRVGIASLYSFQAGQLSAGQKRRLALARLLIQNQPIWLLDEPTAALDARAARMSEELIAAHLTDGGIAIIATHSPFAPKGRVSELNLVAVA